MKNYYILTDTKTKKILISQNHNDIFDFFFKYQNAKIRTIDYTAKPRILHRNKFLTNYLEATNYQNNFFELATILIKRTDNLRKFLSKENLLDAYDFYIKNKNNNL